MTGVVLRYPLGTVDKPLTLLFPHSRPDAAPLIAGTWLMAETGALVMAETGAWVMAETCACVMAQTGACVMAETGTE